MSSSFGEINANGTIVFQAGLGSLQSVSRTGTGVYVLTFSKQIFTGFIITTSLSTAGYYTYTAKTNSPAQVTINTFDTVGVATDMKFSFNCMLS